MKKLLVISLVFVSGHIFASEESSKPCMEVKKACEAAGFVKGQHKEGKGLHIDCMKKLAAGETVAGVNVSADLVAACKDKRAEKKSKK